MRMTAHSLSVLVMMSLSGCIAGLPTFTAEETRDQYTAFIPGSIIEIKTTNGWVEVIAAPDREDIHVHAEVTAGGGTVEQAEQRLADMVLNIARDTSRTLSIAADFPTPGNMRDRVNLTIRVPGEAELRIESTNGSVRVNEMSGQLTVKSTNGRVTIEEHHGAASVTTTNGRIRLEQHRGDVTARSTNGRVVLVDHDGSAEVRTTNGRITASLTPNQPGPLQLQTVNGRIEATVGPAFAGELTMQSSNGSLSVSDTTGAVQTQDIQRRSGTVVFTNDGEPSKLRTRNGRISLTVSE